MPAGKQSYERYLSVYVLSNNVLVYELVNSRMVQQEKDERNNGSNNENNGDNLLLYGNVCMQNISETSRQYRALHNFFSNLGIWFAIFADRNYRYSAKNK